MHDTVSPCVSAIVTACWTAEIAHWLWSTVSQRPCYETQQQRGVHTTGVHMDAPLLVDVCLVRAR